MGIINGYPDTISITQRHRCACNELVLVFGAG